VTVRVLQVYSPNPRLKNLSTVRRLWFDPTGTRLVAWVGYEDRTAPGRTGSTRAVHEYDLLSGRSRAVVDEEQLALPEDEPPDPAISPDLRYLAQALSPGLSGDVLIKDLTRLGEPLPQIRVWSADVAAVAFTPDGRSLIAARNVSVGNTLSLDVVWLSFGAYLRAPIRYQERQNPFTGQPCRVVRPRPVSTWKPLAALPGDKPVCSLAVAADGRWLAVGTWDGWVHVVGIRPRRVVGSFQWPGKHLRDRAVYRSAVDPTGRWVAAIAHGQVFARPLIAEAGKGWATTGTLGYAHDLAYHPNGAVLAVVDDTGHARFLDPASGKIRNSFRWAIGPLYSVAFAPDGLTCAAGGENGQVVVWDVDG
jgi:WD40 repeat protein